MGALVAAFAASTASMVAAPSAVADTNCGSSVNGWEVYATVRTSTYNGHTVKLVNGRLFDESYGWISAGYDSADQVWVERRRPGGAISTCGPFSRSYTNELYNIGYDMRACASYWFNPVPSITVRGSHCTSWYYDAD